MGGREGRVGRRWVDWVISIFEGKGDAGVREEEGGGKDGKMGRSVV